MVKNSNSGSPADVLDIYKILCSCLNIGTSRFLSLGPCKRYKYLLQCCLTYNVIFYQIIVVLHFLHGCKEMFPWSTGISHMIVQQTLLKIIFSALISS